MAMTTEKNKIRPTTTTTKSQLIVCKGQLSNVYTNMCFFSISGVVFVDNKDVEERLEKLSLPRRKFFKIPLNENQCKYDQCYLSL